MEHVSLPPGVGSSQVNRIREAYKKRPPIDVLEALTESEFDRIVLLGDPGSGKSTLARYLALALTSGEVIGELTMLSSRLPIVIELRRYAEEQWRERTFEEFLGHLYVTEGMCVPPTVLREILAQGKFVALFDGLDEVFDPAVRKVVAQRIAAFAASYPRGRFVVTSRTIGYQRGILDGAGFKHYMLQDLDEGKIGEFCKLWYTNACPNSPAEASELVRRLTEAVAHSRPIRELAGNPLLLTILAIIGRRQSLPRDRQGVYRHAVTVLVAHLDQDVKHLKHTGRGAALLDVLDAEDLHELLMLLARHMQEGRGGIAGNHIHGQELELIIQEYLQQYELPLLQAKECARAMVGRLRERNFILSRYGGEVYGFVHRAFLEYLAAADIVHRYTTGREWGPEELINDVIGKRANNPSWHEVVLLIIGQLNERDAARAIDHLLQQHRVADQGGTEILAMVLRALAEVRKIGALTDQTYRFILHLAHSLQVGDVRNSITAYSKAIPVLSTFGEFWKGRPLYLRWFHAYGQFIDNGEVAARAAGALYNNVGFPAILTAHAPQTQVRAVMLQCTLRNWPDLPETLELVRERAVADAAGEVRRAAVTALAEHWGDLPETLELVRERAVADAAGEVRRAAVTALAEHWGDLP
ncbi:NACHT domain-containing protein, partial [Streptomyces rochei]|uniref:NACHT domain-containing protein n=1 Tax=Streptomyces rochei TaxID=1928 RepID=UPI00369B3B4B